MRCFTLPIFKTFLFRSNENIYILTIYSKYVFLVFWWIHKLLSFFLEQSWISVLSVLIMYIIVVKYSSRANLLNIRNNVWIAYIYRRRTWIKETRLPRLFTGISSVLISVLENLWKSILDVTSRDSNLLETHYATNSHRFMYTIYAAQWM